MSKEELDKGIRKAAGYLIAFWCVVAIIISFVVWYIHNK